MLGLTINPSAGGFIGNINASPNVLKNKVALISGGTSGINLGIAKAYTAQGAQ